MAQNPFKPPPLWTTGATLIAEACNGGTVVVAHIIGTAISTRAAVVGHGRIETPLLCHRRGPALCHRRGPALSGGGQFNKTLKRTRLSALPVVAQRPLRLTLRAAAQNIRFTGNAERMCKRIGG